MIHPLLKVFEIVAVLGCASSSFYYLLCLWGAASFLRGRRAGGSARPTQDLPAVSILKPLKGTDPEIYQSFHSHCLQDYPAYEIIFGVSDPNDPAVASVMRLQKEFPERRIELVVCLEKLGANIKVSNLEQMLASARYEHLLINDSDIRVAADYLRSVMKAFMDAHVGMVTCLYRGIAAQTLGSKLEALGISTDFIPGVLAARQLEGGLHFALGSTLAFRRSDLQRAGGFHVIVDFLADDYELGRRIADLGLKVQVSEVVVETHLPAYDLLGFLSHQLRWARGVRDSRPGGYFGLLSTFGLMWGLLAVIAGDGAPWSWAALVVTYLLRLAVAMAIGKSLLQDSQILASIWLLPLRDLIAVGIWVASYFGRSVTWRGDRFDLENGKLKPVEDR